MKSGNDTKNIINKLFAFMKRNVLSFAAALVVIVSLFTDTSAWLKRSSLMNVVPGSGFQFTNNEKIMPLDYSVKTYCKNPNGVWKLITEDYVRAEDKTVEWKDKWDDNSPVLVPGKRTEYRTVIKNLTGHTQRVMIHLTDVSVEDEFIDVLSIAVTEPDVVIFESSDTELFGTVSDESGTLWAEVPLLCLVSGMEIPAGETRTVEWNISTSSDMLGGLFPMLTDMDGNPVQESDGSFYSVNKTDDDGNITEAFLCDGLGVLTVSGSGTLTEYPGDYSKVRTDYFLFGMSPKHVRISGMIIAAG